MFLQGTEDKLTPLVMSEYIKRVLPQVELHKLEGEGHFSWYFNCNRCHRELFKTLFGEVAGLEGLENNAVESVNTATEDPVVSENTVTKGPVKSEDASTTESASKEELDDEPLKSLRKPVHVQPEGYFERGPEKPEDGPLNDLAIAEKEAEKIALFKEAGKVPPIEPQIGISPAQYEQLQHEIDEISKNEEL